MRDWVYPAILIGLVLVAIHRSRGGGDCFEQCMRRIGDPWACKAVCTGGPEESG